MKIALNTLTVQCDGPMKWFWDKNWLWELL